MSAPPDVADAVLSALARSVDRDRLREELGAALGPAAERPAPSSSSDLLEKLVLADLLDDEILGARPGDKPFPLRVFFGRLGSELPRDAALALASGLGFYFRASLEEEDRARLGVEVSRCYYRFAAEGGLEPLDVPHVSPLLAALMSSELSRVRLESVDHAGVFDSQLHERDAASDRSSARIVRPATFLCRVSSSGAVKSKARVVT